MAASGRYRPVAAPLVFQPGNLLSLADRPDSAKSGPLLLIDPPDISKFFR